VTEARKELIQAYASAGGKGDRYAEVAMCCAPTEEQGRKTAHRSFRWSLSGWPVLAELPHEEAFAAASEHVPIEAVGKEVSCGPSVDRHLEAIEKYIAIGCDRIVLNQIGPRSGILLRAGPEEDSTGAAQKGCCLSFGRS
jgi:hypothetical protein